MNRIREHYERCGMRRGEVAATIGVNYVTLWRWERLPLEKLRLEMIERIAETLGVLPKDLK